MKVKTNNFNVDLYFLFVEINKQKIKLKENNKN